MIVFAHLAMKLWFGYSVVYISIFIGIGLIMTDPNFFNRLKSFLFETLGSASLQQIIGEILLLIVMILAIGGLIYLAYAKIPWDDGLS